MKVIYNKLIRDRIEEIIQDAGKICKTRILDDNEYKDELKKKLLEEAKEVTVCQSNDDLYKEIADVLEIIEALKKAYDLDDLKLDEIKRHKALKNGAFEKKLFLEYVIEKDK